ncbi:tyrosine phosphatase family protein [Hoeflea olei]|nr:protein tyrosine phosphatase [Hoeflea olei]
MVSLLAEHQDFHRPGVIDPGRHLKLGVNDISELREGLTAPDEAHVDRLIRFARSWDRRAPLLVHCWLGISRSPAAAAIAALAVEPDQDEMALAERLRLASPFISPNRRLVEIGDALLGRDGRFIRAIHAIGRGADAFEGDCFAFAIKPGDELPVRPLPAGTD